MLTGRGEAPDRIAGLELGADDYVPKTFSSRELLARLRAVIRRSMVTAALARRAPNPPVVVGDLRVDPETRLASLEDKPLSLTATEFDLLLPWRAHVDGSKRASSCCSKSPTAISNPSTARSMSISHRCGGNWATTPKPLASSRPSGPLGTCSRNNPLSTLAPRAQISRHEAEAYTFYQGPVPRLSEPVLVGAGVYSLRANAVSIGCGLVSTRTGTKSDHGSGAHPCA